MSQRPRVRSDSGGGEGEQGILYWWPVLGGCGGVGCLNVEEGGRKPGGHERPFPSPEVMAHNILMSSNGDKLDYLRDYIFTVTGSIPSEVT